MKKKQFLGLYYGGIIGDALGVPVEFLDRGAYPKVVTMQAYGTHHQPKGTWSDDTSMILATMDALVKSTQLETTMDAFVQWLSVGEYTPFGNVFDVGIQTRKAVMYYHRTGLVTDQMDSTDEFSNGNGALMRIMPMMVLLTDDYRHNLEVITQFTTLTHPHPRSVLANLIYLLLLDELMQGETVTVALKNVSFRINEYLEQSGDLKREMGSFKRLFSDSFAELPMDEIRSSGYVVDTLEAAVWILLNTNSYKDAVLTAVNMGDDTDTVAEVTGQLAGLVYGYEQIPSEWLNDLQNKPLLAEIAQSFMEKFVDQSL